MNKFAVLCVLLFCTAGLFAQTAQDMDAVLAAENVSYAQAARFVLSASEVLSQDVSAESAFAEALSRGWIPEDTAAEDPISMGKLSLLIMKSFDLSGGFMYALFPVSRYAYRELSYKQIIQGRSDPAVFLSGERFLHILGRTLSYVEEGV
ncbi:hypothetical protein LJC14_06155 [Treponema sp. OttesenSCG-928-L16]|nr:hypothetical protein [Treponema sp. OttesenSCG-928-L16]